jgi:hypothetical protein
MTVERTEIRENIEWTNMRWNDAPDNCKARILLIGDSIVVGHERMLHEIIKDEYCIDSFATAKCVSDVDYMKELDYMLASKDYDLVIFNNGLHGFDIEDEAYEENLEEVLIDLNKRVKNLAWRTSTPIRNKEDLNQFEAEKTPRVIRRNAFAAKVTQELNIPVLDLYTPMAENVDYFSPDAIHYNEEGKQTQAQMLAKFIKGII